jgi:alpha-mannosidase
MHSAGAGATPMVSDASGDSSRILKFDQKTGLAELAIHASNVPALGYKVVEVESRPVQTIAAAQPAASDGNKLVLQDEDIVAAVDKTTGCVTSLTVKRSNDEMLAPNSCGNQLQFFKDLPKQYDAWNIDPGTLDVPPMSIEEADSVESVSGSDGSSAVRVTSHWQNSKFIQTISLKGDIVDVDNDIDWHEKHILLKAAFPLAVTSNFATYEIPYGTIERPTTRNNSWEKAQFEVPALRWADFSGTGADGKVYGLSLLNKDKYGYDAAGNVLRLTLLRSPTWPDPDADQGHQHFHYALYPHAGTWKDARTVLHGWEYDYPLQAVVTTAHAGSLPAEHSFASVGPDNVVLTAVKKAEDANGLIFRAYEWAGKESTAEFHMPPGATGATVTNLMEKPEGSPLVVTANVVKVPIHPYEILTIRVDYSEAGSSQ